MSIANANNPFVGLRPFESDESLLFFGRQDQTVELLQRLHEHHFVGVVGSSGSGKSSLIRAGLIPALKAGYLVNEKDRWLIAIFKPGEDPLRNFAAALNEQSGVDGSVQDIPALIAKIEEEGSDAIVNILQPLIADGRTNVFILVDQFEELFRFSMDTKHAGKKDEAIDFVNILLELVHRQDLPVYVVITMRSDFIGDCSRFFGLPEALNQSQYLVPRLTRVQLKNAIEGPVRLYGGKINPALTSRLLNDVQKVKDELPLLQHALMRTWDYEVKTDNNGELDINDYEAIGTIDKALSNHADEALAPMNEEERRIARIMFQALTTSDPGKRKIRQPAHLSELTALTGVSGDAIMNLVNRFNEDRRSFLLVNKTADQQDPLIDISHESLIRQWETLSKWVDEEAESVTNFARLTESAALYKKGETDLLAGRELQITLNWYETFRPSDAWARRYSPDFAQTFRYLEESRDKELQLRSKIRRKKRNRYIVWLVSGLLVLLTGIALVGREYSNRQKSKAKSLRFRAVENASRHLKVDKFKEYTATALDNEKGLQAFLYLSEALSITRDTMQRDSLASWGEAYPVKPPVFVLQNIIYHTASVIGARFGPSGTSVLVWGQDSSLTEYDLATGRLLRRAKVDISKMATDKKPISPYTAAMFVSEDGNDTATHLKKFADSTIYFVHKFVRVFDKDSQTDLPILPSTIVNMDGAYWSNDRSLVLTWGTNSESNISTVDIWDQYGLNQGPSLIHDGLYGAIISADKKTILTWSSVGTVRIWRFSDNAGIYRLPGQLVKIKGQVQTGVELSEPDHEIVQMDSATYAQRKQKLLDLEARYKSLKKQ